MFKWHIQSAVGRSRPVANDLKVVSDGIAASLRQFHASASQAEVEKPRPPVRTLRITRTATATAELSSLKPSKPRGVDARSLAAAPPRTLNISRTFNDTPQRGGFQARGRGDFVPRGRGGSGDRGRAGFVPRGRGGFGAGGRGGAMSRGRGGATARGRGRGGARGGRGKKSQGPKREAEDYEDVPLSPEELAYEAARDMGVQRAANSGTTTHVNLEYNIPSLATGSAPLGLVETVRDHIRKLTGQHGNELLDAHAHADQYNHGQGTLFLDEADKNSILGPNYAEGTPREYKTISKEEREVIMKSLVGGQYPSLAPPKANDILAGVEIKGNMNPTYLPADTASLKGKVQQLLPVLKPKKSAPAKAGARA
ncbi:hypothetical protein VC83_06416 [Pseudogymnoascus destructans]|uniref:Uncharacterized protein n=2 Tax=Pseudogymnoascus destructans TaxID=655981 RepID=L8GBJ2_PSED2|nr:uncharacterized protein VC83_06416 [Pseudogymnoascus destructans]ELR10013.1 hypothetical protein GMDG_00771 [Pseudogymnoascus destructans 20631-21]OAF58422.1 hypothetical protein VC83_06416 [Pseudogymnoascus destructans]